MRRTAKHHPQIKRSRWPQAAAAGTFAAALLAGLHALTAVEEVWIGTSSGNWSLPGSWLDGSAPLSGGDPALALRFSGSGGTALTATNDLGAFALNSLTLDRPARGALTLASVAGSQLQFAGVAPLIDIAGTGDTTVTSAVTLAPASGALRVEGSGAGHLVLSGPISEAGGTQALVVAGSPVSPNVQTVTLSGNNTFSGGVTLETGNLSLGHSSALGTGNLRIKGGTLRLASSSVAVANAIQLDADLVIQSPGDATISGAITSNAPGTGLTLRNSASALTLTGVSTYSGATTLDQSLAARFAAGGAGTLVLTGAGRLTDSASFRINARSTLQINAAATGTIDRINDAAPIALRSGRLIYGPTGSVTTAQVETVGTISGAGYSTVSVVNPASGGSVRLAATSLDRVERGTFLFNGPSLGAAFANSVGNVLFATTPAGLVGGGSTGAQTSILTYAIGDATATGVGASFVTYSPTTGIRPLNVSTEYVNSLASATATTNVRLPTATANSVTRELNALVLTSVALTGSGTLQITSGAVLNTGASSIANTLSFGSAEGQLFTVGALTVSGVISGSGGLTKSGTADLTLTGANTFTGPLTINAGAVVFSDPAALGADSSPIILQGNFSKLSYVGAAPLTLARGLETRTGSSSIEAEGAGDLTLAGPISGSGGLIFSSPATRTVTLAGNNTYTGPTLILDGTVRIASDSSLGVGGDLAFHAGTLALDGDWTTNREITFAGNVTFDTGASAATWKGLVASVGAITLTKTGSGMLTLTEPAPFSGTLAVNEGAFRLANAGAVRLPSLAVRSGTAVLDNHAQAVADRLDDSVFVSLTDGEFRLRGHGTIPIDERIERITATTLSGTSTVTLETTGNASVMLRAANLVTSGRTLVVRGPNLGGGESSGTRTRLILATLPPAVGGLLTGIYAGTDPNGPASSFAIYDATSDAAGVVGVRPLRADEYAGGAVIQNPSDGGTTPTTGNFLAAAGTTIAGAAPAINSLTFASGGNVTLSAGQTLKITASRLLAQAGNPTAVTGGTLDFGIGAADIFVAGDFTLASSINVASPSIFKRGEGALTIGNGLALPSSIIVSDGTLRAGAPGALAASAVTLDPSSTLDLGNTPATVGSITGAGAVSLGSGTLTLGTLGTAFSHSGTISGTGGVILVDGGTPGTRRILSGASTFSGGVSLQSGELTIGSVSSLGTGTLTVNGGTIRTDTPVAIANSIVANSDFVLAAGLLTLAEGGTFTGAGALVNRSGSGITLERPVTAAEVRSSFASLGDTVGSQGLIAGPIIIGGAAGAYTGTGSVTLGAGTSVILNDQVAFTGAAGGRLNDAAPVELRGATLSLLGNANATTTENVGAIRGAGYSTIAITPRAAAGARLHAASLERLDRGTFLFTSSLGLGGSPAPAMGQVTLGIAPAGVVNGIVPYALTRDTSNVLRLTSFDPANGFRPLSDAETAASLTGATAATDVLLTSGVSNSGAISANSLALRGATTVSGNGSIALTSGTLLYDGSSAITFSNALQFGAAEANLFVTGGNFANLQLSAPMTGSGGLTISGHGLVTPYANLIAGPLTLNGSARLNLLSAATLGAGSDPVVVNGDALGAGLQWEQGGTLNVARDLQVNSGFAALSVRGAGNRLVLNGVISGAGGLHVTSLFGIPAQVSNGVVVLAGANSYSGPTWVEGGLAFASDAAFGNTSAIVLGNSANLRLEGPWTTSRSIRHTMAASSVVDTNGFDATWLGNYLPSGTLTKSGAGTLTYAGESASIGMVSVAGGTLRLAGPNAGSSLVSVGQGATFQVDNSAHARSRSVGGVTLTGGRYLVTGHATTSTTVTGGTLTTSQPLSIVELDAAGARITQSFSSFSPAANTVALFRGDDLGSLTRITFSQTAPTLANGLVPGAIVDTSATGGGNSFATYDTTNDGNGVIGIRALRPDEYATGAVLQNPVNGGVTSPTANFLATGAVSATGTVSTLNSLTLVPAATLTLDPAQTLTLAANSVLARPGGGAAITGGTLANGASALKVFGDGNLTLGAKLSGTGGLTKYGNGALTITAPVSGAQTLTVVAGGLRPGAGDPLSTARIDVQRGGSFDLNGNDTRIASILGGGEVALGGSTLTLQNRPGAFATTTFDGTLSGGGGLNVSSNVNFTLTGASSYTGPTRVTSDRLGDISSAGSLTLNAAGRIAASSGYTVEGGAVLRLSNQNAFMPISRIGTAPITLEGSTLSLQAHPGISFTQSAGALSIAGVGRVALSGDSSTQTVVETRISFAGLARRDRGTVAFDFANNGGTGTVGVSFPASVATQLVGDGATATRRGILPMAVASRAFSSTDIGLVTFDAATGIRELAAGEYATTLVAGENVSLTSFATLNSDVTVNALRLDSAPISGTGRLSLTSGVLISESSSVSNPIALGSVEGIFYSSGSPTITGVISGSNGLTLNHVATDSSTGFQLRGDNTFTGPLTINGGTVTFVAPGNLGADTGPVLVNDATLSYRLSSPRTLSRNFAGLGSRLTFDTMLGGRLTLSGTISGAAAVVFANDIVLAGANTYSGNTLVRGQLAFGGDAAFGASPAITLLGGTGNSIPRLVLNAPWTTAREVRVTNFTTGGSAVIDTGAFDATLSGPLAGESTVAITLTKAGTGTLRLAGPVSYTGGIAVNAGTVSIEHEVAVGSALSVGLSGTLTGDGQIQRAVNVSGTLAPGNGTGKLRTGSLTFAGGATLSLALDSGNAYDQVEVNGALTLNGTTTLALELAAAFDPHDFVDTFTVILNDGVDAIAGTGRFSYLGEVLDQNEEFLVGSQAFRISYFGGDGNDVTLIATPEPTSAMLTLSGLALLARRHRRRAAR